MTTRWEDLKAKLPEMLGSIPGKAQKTSSEWCAPCPKCGGDDRFLIWPSEDAGRGRFKCRGCGAGGDLIDLHCFLQGVNRAGLLKLYFNGDQPIQSNKTAKKNNVPVIQKNQSYRTTEEIDKRWHLARTWNPNDPWHPVEQPARTLLYAYLCVERKIPRQVVDAAILAGNVAQFEMQHSAGILNSTNLTDEPTICFLYETASGDPIAIQHLSISGGSLLDSDKPVKKAFERDNRFNEGFYFCGKTIEDSGTVVFCEAAINGLSIVAIMPDVSVVALGSAEGVSKISKLKGRLSSKQIICFFDFDGPGEKAVLQVLKSLQRNDIKKVQWGSNFPPGSDTNDLLKAGQSDLIKSMIENAGTADPQEISDQCKDSLSDTEQQILKFNKVYAAVMNGAQFCILKETIDPIFNRPDFVLLKPIDFHNWHANDKILIAAGESGEMVSVSKLWITSPLRRQYAGIVFSPNEDKPGYYNLWRGLAIQPRQGEWSRIRSHILNIICDGDIELFQWVLAWFARIVQDPGGDRPGTSIVLRGKQGCGKGSLISAFGPIFGQHFLHIQNKRHILGNFNALLKDAIFVFLDEAFWGGDRQEAGTLKTLITEKAHAVEYKGKDAFFVKNHVNLIMASNNNWCVPAGFEERRFCVIDVSDQCCGSRRYFEALHQEMENGGREAMLYDLLSMDIRNIDLRTIPRTDALVSQIVESMDTVESFWFDCLYRGKVGNEGSSDWPEGEFLLSTLHGAYLDFCRIQSERYPKATREFIGRIKELSPSIHRRRRNVDPSGKKKEQVIGLPHLDTARAQFEMLISKHIDWSDTDE